MNAAPVPAFMLMSNPIQHYEWGSYDALNQLFGIANENGKPQAELWMGAHPNGCSWVNYQGQAISLSELIKLRPEQMLGQATLTRYGELPFLFKVLSAQKALSIQVHPSKAQAQLGYAKEQAAGIDIKASHRNYRDANHKPELIYALTPYQAMNGFRPLTQILALFQEASIPALQTLLNQYERNLNEHGLASFFQALLSLQGESKEQAIADLLSFAQAHPLQEGFSLINKLAEQYPSDVGLFAPLLLNVVNLKPGQAMYLDACTPHAYIQGTGLEIMANSDNVLRAGLTPKFIDVAELMRCTRAQTKPADDMLLHPQHEGNVQHFAVPVPDFTFSIYPQGLYQIPHQRAEILFVIQGNATVCYGDQQLQFIQGQSIFIPAATGQYQLTIDGKLARASHA